jgi:hypothetical protein
MDIKEIQFRVRMEKMYSKHLESVNSSIVLWMSKNQEIYENFMKDLKNDKRWNEMNQISQDFIEEFCRAYYEKNCKQHRALFEVIKRLSKEVISYVHCLFHYTDKHFM